MERHKNMSISNIYIEFMCGENTNPVETGEREKIEMKKDDRVRLGQKNKTREKMNLES